MKSSDKSDQIVQITRITLPRYEVEYRERAVAAEHARLIKKNMVFGLPVAFPESMGQEVVLDLSVREITFKATLLFRLIQKTEKQTLFEWWCRRKTDPDLLELWLEALEQKPRNKAGAQEAAEKSSEESQGLPINELHQLYEICRRALSANPFTALGIHWMANASEIEQAYSRMMEELEAHLSYAEENTRLRKLITKAQKGVMEIRKSLSSLQQRQRIRAQFIPENQLITARELSESKLNLARLRNDKEAFKKAQRELHELTI